MNCRDCGVCVCVCLYTFRLGDSSALDGFIENVELFIISFVTHESDACRRHSSSSNDDGGQPATGDRIRSGACEQNMQTRASAVASNMPGGGSHCIPECWVAMFVHRTREFNLDRPVVEQNRRRARDGACTITINSLWATVCLCELRVVWKERPSSGMTTRCRPELHAAHVHNKYSECFMRSNGFRCVRSRCPVVCTTMASRTKNALAACELSNWQRR